MESPSGHMCRRKCLRSSDSKPACPAGDAPPPHDESLAAAFCLEEQKRPPFSGINFKLVKSPGGILVKMTLAVQLTDPGHSDENM